MKKIILLFSVFFLLSGTAFATKHTISTLPMSFSPEVTVANVGDTIVFVVGDFHTATQVSLDSWNANLGSPLSDGFNFPSGTIEYVLQGSDVGIVYFVCLFHVSMGMKGSISVQSPTGIQSIDKGSLKLSVFPSKIKENEMISVELPGSNFLDVKVYDIVGREVASVKSKDFKLSLPASFGRGIYLVRVTDSFRNAYVQKILVE